ARLGSRRLPAPCRGGARRAGQRRILLTTPGPGLAAHGRGKSGVLYGPRCAAGAALGRRSGAVTERPQSAAGRTAADHGRRRGATAAFFARLPLLREPPSAIHSPSPPRPVAPVAAP